MTLKLIAYARNGHTDKFGIPRQSREESPILTRIVFEPEYRVAEALRGIEGYSHLWLIWGFSEQPTPNNVLRTATGSPIGQSPSPVNGGELSWSPTVRPPRLGGNKRMGVFATRSPFRPNPIGLSSVRLVKAYPRPLPEGKGVSWELLVSGADVLDGTPIYDIKPYLSFSDSHPEAKNGFADETRDYHLEVVWEHEDSTSIGENHEQSLGLSQHDKDAITYILAQDPRPGYQDDPKREYKMDYAGWTVTFVVQPQEGDLKHARVVIRKIEKI